MKDGTSTKVPNAARDDKRLLAEAALAIWNERVKKAEETGKKLQQGSFSLTTEDGKTSWFVRPLRSGLQFYSKMELEVQFVAPPVKVETKVVGLPEAPAAQAAPSKRAQKRAAKRAALQG